MIRKEVCTCWCCRGLPPPADPAAERAKRHRDRAWRWHLEAERQARAQLGWTVPRLDRAYPDEECGCPVEEWVYGGINLQLHFEPDGSLEIFADCGEWDCEVALKATTIEDARREAFAWVDALPREA